METAEKAQRPCKRLGIDLFALHITAAALMLCGYLGGCISGAEPLCALGRLAFPLLAFMLTEGCAHTSHKGKYALRLLIFAFASEVPFNRVGDPMEQNVLWTLLLCLGMLCILGSIRKLPYIALRLALYVAVIFVFYNAALLLLVEYYGCGILTAALFYFTKTDEDAPKYRKVLQKLTQTVGMFIIFGILMRGAVYELSIFGMEFEIYKQTFAVLSLLLIWLYSGQKGRYNEIAQYVFYISYPLMLCIVNFF